MRNSKKRILTFSQKKRHNLAPLNFKFLSFHKFPTRPISQTDYSSP
uniref:Uncharacterized protein n=1 Tax=Rhizophora mucronata TaxID=61149 RepID=A0A2P2QI61_RHIMU